MRRAFAAAILGLAACAAQPVRQADELGSLRGPPGGAEVVVFTTTDCPIANGYAPRLRELAARFADAPVVFHLVHVDPKLSVGRARDHALEYRLDWRLVLDPRHELVRQVGATVTPEAAVYDDRGVMRYRGRIDNWYGDIGRKRPRATRHELRDAIDAVLLGREPTVTRTEAVGCVIEPL